MIVLRLALQSLRNRWITALLTVLAIAVSIVLLLETADAETAAAAGTGTAAVLATPPTP